MLKIRKLTIKEDVYDINVEDNHNFYANDILVHNCVESFSISKETTKAIIEIVDGRSYTRETDGLYHSCLTGDTIINTDKGNMRLDEAVKRVTLGDDLKTKSYNIDTGKIEYNKILAGEMTRKNAKILKVKYNGRELVCTPDHKIFTKNRGYVEAKDLKTDDILILD